MSDEQHAFEHPEDFRPSAPSGGLGLGILESQYQELFAEALEDGVITPEERERLEKAASNMGLDAGLLDRLEEAMTAAYETHHRVRVVDQSRPSYVSITPLKGAPPPSVQPKQPPAKPTAETNEELESLRAENAELKDEIAALQAALEEAQASVNVEVDLGEWVGPASGEDLAPEEAWKRVRQSPSEPEGYRNLADAHRQAGSEDGLYLTAQALVALGKANEEERARFERHRPEGLIAPYASIDDALWQSTLFHPEQEPLTGAIFSVIAPAVLIGRVTTLRRDGALHVPREEDLQDPAQTTVMAVRAVGWAATLLGLPTPRVYIEKEREDAYRHVAGVPPFSVVGRGALSGRSAPELAFLVGRHMSGYRGEHFVKTLFSATEDLEDLFLAALLIANPKLPVHGAKRARVEPLARAIEPLLEPAQLDALRTHYLSFADQGGRTNLQRWGSAVEKTGARVGLALSQDLPRCVALLESEEGPQGPLTLDLLAYSTSPRFLRLRRSLGIGLDAE